MPLGIISNSKCSGYFVEPVRISFSFEPIVFNQPLRQLPWMQAFLEAGEISGKLICPKVTNVKSRAKCGAKLGSYDWKGVACGCGEWIVPVIYITSAVLYGTHTVVIRAFVSIGPRWMRFLEDIQSLSKAGIVVKK
jgi:hypothetical protein